MGIIVFNNINRYIYLVNKRLEYLLLEYLLRIFAVPLLFSLLMKGDKKQKGKKLKEITNYY